MTRQIGTILVHYQPTTIERYGYYYVEINTPRRRWQRLAGDGSDPQTAANALIEWVNQYRDWVNIYRDCYDTEYEKMPVQLGERIPQDLIPENAVAGWRMLVPVN